MPVTIQPGSLKYKNSQGQYQTADCLRGEDGLSPSVTVTDIAGGHRVTVTDANGPHTFDVMDGAGDPSLLLAKADKADTVLDTTLSCGRKEETTVGDYSVAFGDDVTASGNLSQAFGDNTTSSGPSSHAEGSGTLAEGEMSHAEGQDTIAGGVTSHAEGLATIAAGRSSHVFGEYNIEDDYEEYPSWVANTEYSVGDRVMVITRSSGGYPYECITANSDAEFTPSNWRSLFGLMHYVEIVGNGVDDNARSNARALSWDGNEYLMGNLYVNCDEDSTGGVRVITKDEVATLEEIQSIIGGPDDEDEDALIVETEFVEDHLGNYYESVLNADEILDAYTSGRRVVFHIPDTEVDDTPATRGGEISEDIGFTLIECYAEVCIYDTTYNQFGLAPFMNAPIETLVANNKIIIHAFSNY